MATLLPGTIGVTNDVGGTKSMQIQAYSIHGSRTGDQRLMVNGLTSRNLLASAWASNYVPDMGMAAEIALDYSSGGADSIGGGLGINVIPKEGGNRFSGSFFTAYANSSFQSSNYTDELKAQGLGSPNKLKRVYDVNPAVGGPVFKDKLWFYASIRWQESSNSPAGAFINKNGGDLSKWTYEADPSQVGRQRPHREAQRRRSTDLPGDAAEQVRLLGRASSTPLDPGSGQYLRARGVSGLAVQPRVLHDRVVDVAGDQ